jgi:hypothetical protein
MEWTWQGAAHAGFSDQGESARCERVRAGFSDGIGFQLSPDDRRDRIDGKIRDSIELRDVFLKIDEDIGYVR